MTAGEVVDRIKKNLGVPWRDTTYRDTFKFGGPETEVTGIATTVFCSFEVVQKASAAGCNMIIPHEDTYWNEERYVNNGWGMVDNFQAGVAALAAAALVRSLATKSQAWLLVCA